MVADTIVWTGLLPVAERGSTHEVMIATYFNQEAPVPFYVRNKLNTQHLFTRVDGQAIAWKPFGDPEGGDIAMVEDAVKDDIGFIQATRRGSLEVITENEALSAIDAQDEAALTHEAAGRTITANVINRLADKTMGANLCIGPSPSKNKPCGDPVITHRADIGNVPPLCPRHKSLAGQYVPVEGTERNEDTGKVETAWKRVTVAKH